MREIFPACFTSLMLLVQSVIIFVTFDDSSITVHDANNANWPLILVPLWILLLLLFLYFTYTFVVVVRSLRANVSEILFLAFLSMTLLGVGITLAVLLGELYANEVTQSRSPSTNLSYASLPLMIFSIVNLLLIFGLVYSKRESRVRWAPAGGMVAFGCLLQAAIIFSSFNDSAMTIESVGQADWAVIMTPTWVLLILLFFYCIYMLVVISCCSKKYEGSDNIIFAFLLLLLLGIGLTFAILLGEVEENENKSENLKPTNLSLASLPLMISSIANILMLFTFLVYQSYICSKVFGFFRYCCSWGNTGYRRRGQWHRTSDKDSALSTEDDYMDGTNGGTSPNHAEDAIKLQVH